MKSMTQSQHIPTIYGTSGMVLNQVYYQVYHIYSNPQNDGKVKFQSQDNMEAVRSFGGSQSPNRDLGKTHWDKKSLKRPDSNRESVFILGLP